jgi:YD repeat-containing protein
MTQSDYNGKNQLLWQKDAARRTVISNQYDLRSQQLLESSVDALDQATGFGYYGGTGLFGSGQLRCITGPDNASTCFEYDPRGYTQATVDALQHRTESVHDDLGRVTLETRWRTNAAGVREALVTEYGYDDKGRLERTVHPDGSETTLRYEGLDQPRFECDALARCTEHVYNDRASQSWTPTI